jgi:hypothetical protein
LFSYIKTYRLNILMSSAEKTERCGVASGRPSSATPDKVLDEVKGTGGKILNTSLFHDDEAKLQAALSAARK